MSRAIPLKTRPGLIPDDRNFGAIVENGELFVPEKLLPLIVEFRIASSDLLYALVLTDPRSVADALGWTLEQVSKARKGLGDLIQRSTMPPPPSAKSSRPTFAPPPQYRPPSSLPPRPKPSFAPPPSMPPKKRSG